MLLVLPGRQEPTTQQAGQVEILTFATQRQIALQFLVVLLLWALNVVLGLQQTLAAHQVLVVPQEVALALLSTAEVTVLLEL